MGRVDGWRLGQWRWGRLLSGFRFLAFGFWLSTWGCGNVHSSQTRDGRLGRMGGFSIRTVGKIFTTTGTGSQNPHFSRKERARNGAPIVAGID